MNREKVEKVPTSSILEGLRKAFGKKMCLHPKASDGECKGNIVKAHTIQRVGLSKIAENGHVYWFRSDDNAFRPETKKTLIMVPHKIGIKGASTFTGFCAKHDNETFRPIEIHTFKCCQEHAFLLGYRALCREIFAKKAVLEMQHLYKTMDSGQPLEIQIPIQRFANAFLAGAKAGLDDLQKIKSTYDRILEHANFEQVRYYTLLFDTYPDILCSGGFWPEYDFKGSKVQNPITPDPDGIQFSLITTDKGGAAVFTWVKNRGISEKFIESLDSIPNSDLPHAIIRFVFEYFENTYLRPSWWENLSMDIRKKLHNRMAQNVMIHNADCLIDDGLRTVNWRVNSRRTNFSIL
jgi:hypothetical protein